MFIAHLSCWWHQRNRGRLVVSVVVYFSVLFYVISMFTFACLCVLAFMTLLLFICLLVHVSVCMLLSSHWLKQSGGGFAGPISGGGVGVSGNAESTEGGSGRNHAAKE